MTIHAIDKNMSIANYIVGYRDRPEGSTSKLNTVSDGFKVLGMIFRLFKNYRPFSFFTLFAGICAAISLGIAIPAVLIPYFETGLVEKFPTLIVCGFIMIAAIQSFYTGMVLNTIVQKEKREFEFRLQIVSEEKGLKIITSNEKKRGKND